MTNETIDYKGRIVSIDLSEDSRGGWSWSYTIDGDMFTESKDRPLKSKGITQIEAKHDAMFKIDSMK